MWCVRHNTWALGLISINVLIVRYTSDLSSRVNVQNAFTDVHDIFVGAWMILRPFTRRVFTFYYGNKNPDNNQKQTLFDLGQLDFIFLEGFGTQFKLTNQYYTELLILGSIKTKPF